MQEEQDHSIEHDIAAQTFAWQQAPAKSSKFYIWGSILGLVLLAAQVNHFLAYKLAQNPQVRPYLITVSQLFNQSLPTYKNSSDFTVIGSHLSPEKNKQYRVKISFINHADFPQHTPYLLLTLRNIQGGLLTQRYFSSETYQPAKVSNSIILPNELFTIDFLINIPSHHFAGYNIELKHFNK
ncbi:MAG: DUF3426 domain-containing protein [Methyloprofundus sp.]|nr:DUF3426 domain-containing protein [Methyloprofundus sp.]